MASRYVRRRGGKYGGKSRKSIKSGRKFKRSRRLGKRIKRVERAVKRVSSSIETKHILKQDLISGGCNYPDDTDAATDAMTYNITLTSQGTGLQARVGDKIKLTSLFMKGTWYRTTAAGSDHNQQCRVLIVRDKDPASIGHAPHLGQIFKLPYTYANTDTDMKMKACYHAPINWDNRHKYDILYDKLVTVNPLAAGAHYPTVKNIGFKKMKLPYQVTYPAAGTSPNKNAIWLYFISDNKDVAHGPTFSYTVDVKFRDA